MGESSNRTLVEKKLHACGSGMSMAVAFAKARTMAAFMAFGRSIFPRTRPRLRPEADQMHQRGGSIPRFGVMVATRLRVAPGPCRVILFELVPWQTSWNILCTFLLDRSVYRALLVYKHPAVCLPASLGWS